MLIDFLLCFSLIFVGRAMQLGAPYIMSESVRLSVCHTREARRKGSRYRNTLYAMRQRYLSSCFRPDFPIPNVRGSPPDECVKGRAIVGPVIHHILEKVQEWR